MPDLLEVLIRRIIRVFRNETHIATIQVKITTLQRLKLKEAEWTFGDPNKPKMYSKHTLICSLLFYIVIYK